MLKKREASMNDEPSAGFTDSPVPPPTWPTRKRPPRTTSPSTPVSSSPPRSHPARKPPAPSASPRPPARLSRRLRVSIGLKVSCPACSSSARAMLPPVRRETGCPMLSLTEEEGSQEHLPASAPWWRGQLACGFRQLPFEGSGALTAPLAGAQTAAAAPRPSGAASRVSPLQASRRNLRCVSPIHYSTSQTPADGLDLNRPHSTQLTRI